MEGLEEIEAEEVECEDFEDGDGDGGFEISCGESVRAESQACADQNSGRELGEERENSDGFDFVEFFLGSVFGDEELEGFGQPEVVVVGEDADDAECGVDHADFCDAELVGEHHPDEVARGCDEEGEEIEPFAVVDDFVFEAFVGQEL